MRRILCAVVASAAAFCLSQPASGGDLLQKKILDRRFPFQYCPFETRDVDPSAGEFGLFFTPGGTQVHITISSHERNANNILAEQKLDNIAVVRADVFAAHSAPTPNFTSCYNDTLPGFPNTGPNAPSFLFDAGLVNGGYTAAEVPYFEDFDTDPNLDPDPARHWTTNDGGAFLAQGDTTDCTALDPRPSSAPRNTILGTDCTGGAWRLGPQSSTDSTMSSSFDVAGLVPGTSYLVFGWWDFTDVTLTTPLDVTIEGARFVPPGAEVLIALNDVGQTADVDELLRIPDPGTGVADLIGSLGNGFRDVEAMAVLRANAGPERIFAVDNARLLELDPATGNGTVIGPIGFQDVDGIAFRPGTHELYGVTYGGNQLIRIDLTTGQGTLVSDHVLVSHRLEDIAFHPDGRAFVLTGATPRLFQIDIQTGTHLQRWDLQGATSLESLVFSTDGTTLYTAGDRDIFKDLARIDLATSTVTFVSPTLHSGFRDIEALAWVTPPTAQLLSRWNSTDVAPLARGARLLQNVPNPFNPWTRILFELERPEHVRLRIHDVSGRLVATVFEGQLGAGAHAITWNGRRRDGTSVAAGLYQYTLEWSGGRASRQMVVVK